MNEVRVTPGDWALRLQVMGSGQLLLDGQPLPYRLSRDGQHVYQLTLHGRTHELLLLGVSEDGAQLRVQVNGKRATVQLADPAARYKALIGLDKAGARTAADLKAPMPGLVRGIRVNAGDRVQKGDPLVVLEAMKMENILKATGEATVAAVVVAEGAAVEKGALLVRFE